MELPDFLKSTFVAGPQINPLDVFVRLLLALGLGGAVAGVYRRTHRRSGSAGSFPVTLVLLSVLIAMVTQVIGDNVARAFSLVGALSIVRFRTVVRDTLDTAYVIFAVVVGMAVGAQNLWVALLGLGVVGTAAFFMTWRKGAPQPSSQELLLDIRVGMGRDIEKLLGGILGAQMADHELLSVATTKDGLALDVTYSGCLRTGESAHGLIHALNLLEGVQRVRLQRPDADED
jgi:hypothetical protein